MQKIKPSTTYRFSNKKEVKEMFDSISNEYDFLNKIISFGNHLKWKKEVLSIAKQIKPKTILDIATGTADIAIELSKIKDSKITGIDISNEMLKIAETKTRTKNLSKQIKLEYQDAENLKYDDNSFDLITIGFGVRNFKNLGKGLIESYRVLKKNGMLIILETSLPKSFIIKHLYLSFSRIFLPLAGILFSNNMLAYNYLYKTAAKFPSGEKFVSILEKHGYKKIKFKNRMYGAVSIYSAFK
mgnify:FL=1|tara:strand:+ start:36 stop:761 length:726 start_codon:yes stop_codon:yes gene_type:complete